MKKIFLKNPGIGKRECELDVTIFMYSGIYDSAESPLNRIKVRYKV